jgi:hypothetical protein
MLIDPYNPVLNTIIIYIIIMLLLVSYKPKIIFDKRRQKYKSFGIGKYNSLFSLPVLAIIIAIMIYAFFTKIENYCLLQDKYFQIIQDLQLKSK